MNTISLQGSAFRTKVIGVGRSGCQILNQLAEESIRGTEFIAIDTDSQALLDSRAHRRLVIGDQIIGGRGTDGNPNIGQIAVEESIAAVEEVVRDSDLIFITAGLGGGTGTGVAPVIASLGRKHGALTIGVVTTPFEFEGHTRLEVADIGREKLRRKVDALISVSGNSLISRLDSLFIEKASNLFIDTACRIILGIHELISVPGLINLDFMDLRSILLGGALSSMAYGVAVGEDRARLAAENALSNVLGEIRVEDAKSLLFNITGSTNMTLFEVNQAAASIREISRPDVNMIFGAVIDPDLNNEIHVTILASGLDDSITTDGHDDGVADLTRGSEKGAFSQKKLRVFLCHSSSDKPIVRKLYQRLYSRKGIDPWLDEAKLLPGEHWDFEITKAVRETEVVVVCLSSNAINKEGYVQKEIKRALDIADEKPEGTIFIIPLKLEECAVPKRLSDWQWVNYYEEGAFERLMQSLRKRAEELGIKID